MIIKRISNQLCATKELAPFIDAFLRGQDATLSISHTGRVLMMAALFAKHPKQYLYVVSGEEAAQKAARNLRSWLGETSVFYFCERTAFPWQKQKRDTYNIGIRARALDALAQGKQGVIVASARALLRKVPDYKTEFYKGIELEVGKEYSFEELGEQLISYGYTNTGELDGPATMAIHGDIIDIFPSTEEHPYRLEFFGDELDRIRSLVVGTQQAIADVDSLVIFTACEYQLIPQTIARAKKALWQKAQDDSDIAAQLEAIEERIPTEKTQLFAPYLYNDFVTPVSYVSDTCTVVFNEPRALMDDCKRFVEEMKSSAQTYDMFERTSQFYGSVADLSFSDAQQISFSSLKIAATSALASLEVNAPRVSAGDEQLLGVLRGYVNQDYACAFAVDNRQAKKNLEELVLDAHIPFLEAGSPDDPTDCLARGKVTFFDANVSVGSFIPAAKLAVISTQDLVAHTARKEQKQIDITQVTFSFKPGDYVVHERRGIGKFVDVVKRTVDGVERDFFLLQYAEGAELYVPLERVGFLTRYIGATGEAPTLTRLGTKDWQRALSRAKKNAKKLAFDLVDLYARRATITGHAFSPDTAEQREMEAAFPYELTQDQKNALADIKADMESERPMDRLLSGDVGFGKTEVALRAAFKAVQDGKQVFLLCPTTILAQQHYETFKERFAPFGVEVEVLSRFRTQKEQKKTLASLAKGTTDVLIGTHRLLSADVSPKDLGLVIVDEEQRFGVSAKEQLKNLRSQIDMLSLSATPIPRTLQLSLSGVRDMSLILSAPQGRMPVKVHVGEIDEDVISDAIRNEMARGGQTYYVSNRVQTIDEAYARVQEAAPEARIGVAHGQMTSAQIEDVMERFSAGELDVLVATTIIESGIDNPRTNTLIIEDSQRLGLAQLYQLKGRVGRGNAQAYAYFLFPSTQPLTREATERLCAIDEFQELGSGIRIAMRDLEIRGAGSVIGAEQHGNVSRVGFDLFTELLSNAVNVAKGEIEEEPLHDVVINVGVDMYLDDDYIEDIEERVLLYRRLASAKTLEFVDTVAKEVEKRYGELPGPAQNLFASAKLRIMAQQFGVTEISRSGANLQFLGISLTQDAKTRLEAQGARIFVMSKKMTIPLRDKHADILPQIIDILSQAAS